LSIAGLCLPKVAGMVVQFSTCHLQRWPNLQVSGKLTLWVGRGRETVGCIGGTEAYQQSLTRLLHHEQTFIYCKEAFAQGAAAAAELHPQPAVRGDEWLRDLITTKPPWRGEKIQSGHRGTVE
jgi:hypothetical protein